MGSLMRITFEFGRIGMYQDETNMGRVGLDCSTSVQEEDTSEGSFKSKMQVWGLLPLFMSLKLGYMINGICDPLTVWKSN